jgi:hemoglobin
MKEITSKEDIVLLVELFYEKVLEDEILAPYFRGLDFEKHMPKMVQFWSFVLLNEPGYTTNITEKHASILATSKTYMHWNKLFAETVDSNFKGKLANEAKIRAYTLAWTMGEKLGIKEQ